MSSVHVNQVCVAGSGVHPLLDDVTVEIGDGATVAIIGPSAESRTALLRVIIGLDQPDSGQILLDGKDVLGEDPRGRGIAMAFADHALYPHLDVVDNLAFAALLVKGVDRPELAARIEAVVDELALSDLLNLKPQDLSAEQQQRVALGRVLVREANAYLFDDPFSAQAERIRPHIRSVVHRWQVERERTTIFTTAVVSEALTMADEVVVMHRGRVHQVGSPRDIFHEPADLFVAGFVGVPPMNLLPGFVQEDQIHTPIGSLVVPPEYLPEVGDRQVVILGVRPEHCHQVSLDDDPDEGLAISGQVDDLEWRGDAQYAFLGFAVEPELSSALDEIEENFGFDLFQPFLISSVSAEAEIAVGDELHLVVPAEFICLFDPETGLNLSRAHD